jgi:hypothetical protein
METYVRAADNVRCKTGGGGKADSTGRTELSPLPWAVAGRGAACSGRFTIILRFVRSGIGRSLSDSGGLNGSEEFILSIPITERRSLAILIKAFWFRARARDIAAAVYVNIQTGADS